MSDIANIGFPMISSFNFQVIFGPLVSIGSASVPYNNFEIVFMVGAVVTRCTSRV